MIDHQKRIKAHFADSARLKQDAADVMAPHIARAAALLTDCLFADGKILACGNGGSAADAQHFAAELVGRFERERPELPAISLSTDTSLLTAVANDYAFEQVFAKQVRALGTKATCCSRSRPRGARPTSSRPCRRRRSARCA
jgi:D-sedoheptulose 7-phosphate isomerase